MEQVGATTVLEDNQGAIALSKNTGFQSRIKHIAMRYHFARERVASDEIVVEYVNTKHQVADILTRGVATT